MKKILVALSIATCTSIVGVGCTKNEESYNTNNANVQSNSNSKISEKVSDSTTDNLEENNASEKTNDIKNELGDDLLSKKFELEGVVYSLPTQLKDFLNSGWALEDETLKLLKAGERNSHVVLKMDSKSIGISIENQTTKDMNIAECSVNGVLVKKIDTESTSIIVPGNIQIGSTDKDVKNILISYDYEIRESDEVINYTCRKSGFSISALVNKNSGSVFGIYLLCN